MFSLLDHRQPCELLFCRANLQPVATRDFRAAASAFHGIIRPAAIDMIGPQ